MLQHLVFAVHSPSCSYQPPARAFRTRKLVARFGVCFHPSGCANNPHGKVGKASKAPFWQSVGRFWSTPIKQTRTASSACLKGANRVRALAGNRFDRRLRRLVAADQVARLVGDHQGRRDEIGRDHPRHDRGIDRPQAHCFAADPYHRAQSAEIDERKAPVPQR